MQSVSKNLTGENNNNPIYNRAKTWQIGLFSLNHTATSLYTLSMAYMVYFASGVLGLGVAIVSGLLMSIKILDGIIDPFVGWLIDRTNGRFGKFRPFMVSGNVIMIFSLLLVYISQFTGAVRVPVFILAYLVHIFGHTCQ